MNEELFVKLRDCFTAGYTLPQYCIDNGIKKPLFVSEKKYELFLWQVHAQFHYDKRLIAQFSFIDADQAEAYFPGPVGVIGHLIAKNFFAMNLDAFDKIILFTTKNVEVDKIKLIRFADLERLFISRTYIEVPLLNFVQHFPKVKIFLTQFPKTPTIRNTECLSQLYSAEELVHLLRVDKSGNVKTPLDRFGYTNAQVLEISEAPRIKRNLDGTTVLVDDDTKPLQGIKNGKRMTAYQPAHYQNTIYFYCGCHYYGIHAPFDKTIESYLQNMLNKAGLLYRVENESQYFFFRTQDTLYNLNNLKPAPGDIVFVDDQHVASNRIPFADVDDVLDLPQDYQEFCCTKWHFNEIAYKLVAEKYFKFLTENNFFRDKELNYPLPPPLIIDMAYPLGSSKAA